MFRKMILDRDPWSVLVILTTFFLFFLAPFLKGFSHDCLLESAVFLVSLKLILMNRKQIKLGRTVESRLQEILDTLHCGDKSASRSM